MCESKFSVGEGGREAVGRLARLKETARNQHAVAVTLIHQQTSCSSSLAAGTPEAQDARQARVKRLSGHCEGKQVNAVTYRNVERDIRKGY